jgi:hypothetical protein
MGVPGLHLAACKPILYWLVKASHRGRRNLSANSGSSLDALTDIADAHLERGSIVKLGRVLNAVHANDA